MSLLRFLFLLCVISLGVLCAPPSVFALGGEIKITEIIYDLEGADTDREWIEVYNASANAIDLSGWKFFDGSNHVLNAPPANGGQGSLVLPAGGYLIIAHNATMFLSDHPAYDDTVIDSVLSLVNTGDTIKMIDASNVVADEVSYSSAVGANGDGNSLSWYQSGWIATTPSPGAETTGPPPPPPPGGGGGGNNNQVTPVVKPVVFADSRKEPVWMATLTPSMPTIFTHVPFILKTKILDPKKQEHQAGRFVYTLGDGRIVEKFFGDPLEIEYQESGSYVLYFEFYNSKSDAAPSVVEELLIAVEDTPVLLSLSDAPVYKISLSNLYPNSINISGWVLKDAYNALVFPKNTFLPGKREMTLNSSIHALSGRSLTLATPTGHVVARFPSPVTIEPKPTLVSAPVVRAASPATQSVFSDIRPIDPTLTLPDPKSMTNVTYDPMTGEAIKAPAESDLGASAVHTPLGSLDLGTILFIGFAVLMATVLAVTLRKNKQTLLEHTVTKEKTAEAAEYEITENGIRIQ